jgi:Leucine-rich repeat (LRR) protein
LIKLKSVKISDNKIKFLPPGLFRGLSDVEVLQLQNNEIAELPIKIFHDLTSLNQLVLTGNSIVHISPGIFSRFVFLLNNFPLRCYTAYTYTKMYKKYCTQHLICLFIFFFVPKVWDSCTSSTLVATYWKICRPVYSLAWND